MPYEATELAYLAGVLDSDGYIGLRMNTDRRRSTLSQSICPTIQIGQCQIEAVELGHKLFGGRIYKVRNPFPLKDRNLLIVYKRVDIKKLLLAVLPYLRIKRRQAELVLEFVKLRESKLKAKRCSKNTYTEKERQLWLIVKALNQTGKEEDNSL